MEDSSREPHPTHGKLLTPDEIQAAWFADLSLAALMLVHFRSKYCAEWLT
jgi:hypothetical protein